MSYFKRTNMVQWTGASGSSSSAKLPVQSAIHKGKYQVLPFTTLTSGSDTKSEERWVGCRLLESHAKIKNARVTKVHGTYQKGHDLLAGVSATYFTPKTAGVASTIATASIPSHLINGTPLELNFDATDNEYQFLVLQNSINAAVTDWDPTKQEGTSGYAILEVAFAFEERDGDRLMVPGGNAPESTYNRSPVDLYVVIDGQMQLLGCFQNQFNTTFNLEWNELVKGALDGVESRAFSKRTNELTGNLYSMNPYIWQKLFHGIDLGNDGWYRQIQLNSDWKPVENVEVILDTMSDQGRRMLMHSSGSFMKVNGSFDLGADRTAVPFMVDLGNVVNVYQSEDLMDIHRFVIDVTIG